MSPCARFASRGIAFCLALLLGGPAARAQETLPAPLITDPMPVKVDSGLVANTGPDEAVIFRQTIFIPGAAALRLEFDELRLSGLVGDGTGSTLRIRSTLDGAEQRLNALHAEQWNDTSAYFNGDEVIVEIVAKPGTGDNRLRMSTVRAQFDLWDPQSLCGSLDDRVLHADDRAARLLPAGCTGWIVDDCGHCMLTAGHCANPPGYLIEVAEFRVPLSGSQGGLIHPPPEDQYAADPLSIHSNAGQGVGNDFAYLGVFPNSNTGLTPYEAYGGAFQLALPPPLRTQEIRVTGFGIVWAPLPPQWNQAQTTHAGPYLGLSGTTLSHQTDTTSGDSGAPIIDETTGAAVGIHTHAGCTDTAGNYGTGLNHAGLQAALLDPRGVCACPSLVFLHPDGLPESIDAAGGTRVVVEVLGTADAVPVPGTGAFTYDTGDGPVTIAMDQIADNAYAAVFPPAECGAIVRYSFAAQTMSGEIVHDPRTVFGGAYQARAARAPIVLASTDFESQAGWSVQNQNLSGGAWVREAPAGGLGAPSQDFDGSGRCFLTGSLVGVDDVDGGPTCLTSPDYDIEGLENPVVSFARWMYSHPADGDRMTIEVSADQGAQWVWVREVPNAGAHWVEDSFAVRDYLPDASAFRVRFGVADNPDSSITEAALDAFRVADMGCGGCQADFNRDGRADALDVLAFLDAWAAGAPQGDLNGDGVLDILDVLWFLNIWNAGC